MPWARSKAKRKRLLRCQCEGCPHPQAIGVFCRECGEAVHAYRLRAERVLRSPPPQLYRGEPG